MSGITRFIAFVIGLIILVLLFVLIANRFNQDSTQANANNPAITKTPAESDSVRDALITQGANGENQSGDAAQDDSGTTSGQNGDSQETANQDGDAQENGGGFDFFGLFRRNTPTPEPTLTFDEQMGDENGQDMDGDGQPDGDAMSGANGVNGATEIPNTGVPTLLIPLAAAAFGAGVWLKKKA